MSNLTCLALTLRQNEQQNVFYTEMTKTQLIHEPNYCLVFHRLCVILFTKKNQHESEKASLRVLAKQSSLPGVHFLYIYEDVQTGLAEALKANVKQKEKKNETSLKVSSTSQTTQSVEKRGDSTAE